MAKLVNVEKEAKTHADTFLILSKAARRSLVPGDHAKLIWRGKKCGERPWVKVSCRLENGDTRYKGIIDNESATGCSPPRGTEVSFKPENVADIMRRPAIGSRWSPRCERRGADHFDPQQHLESIIRTYADPTACFESTSR